MNVGDVSQAPPEYQEVAWIANACQMLMGIGWTTNYIGMIHKSLKEKTYGMAMMALCCNFTWEVTCVFVYPFGTGVEKYVHYIGFMVNCGVMYTAMKNAHNEWDHAPLVQRNLPLIFVISMAGWMSAHLALAAQVGPRLAQGWSAYGCQLLLSIGAICQLLSRGNSRGASYFIWFSRFFGSLVLIPRDIVRYTYWREAHEYMASPLYLWFISVFLILNGSYGICLWYVRRFEGEQDLAAKKM